MRCWMPLQQACTAPSSPLQHPEEAEAPLLVDVTAEGGAQQEQQQ